MFTLNNLIYLFFNYNVILVSYSRNKIYIKLSSNYIEVYNKNLLMLDKRYKQIIKYALICKFEQKL